MCKKAIILLLFCFFSKVGFAQNAERNRLGFYPTISFLTSFPAGTFKADFDRDVLLGFNVDGVITPVKKNHFWQPGAQIELLLTSNKKDAWKGIEVETGSAFFKFNLINRIRPSYTGRIDPFFEVAYGLNVSSTTTNYEIVDEATFWEEFLLGQEDEIQTVQIKEHNDISSNFAIGIGAFIKNLLMVQLKYNVSPNIEFVNKENIVIINDSVQYQPVKSNMHTISLSVGINFGSLIFE